MDNIQRVLTKSGRKDLAQKYYLKVADLPLAPEPTSINNITVYGKILGTGFQIVFKKTPGGIPSGYNCIKKYVEEFYSHVYERMTRIKEIAEGMGANEVRIPIKEDVFLHKDYSTYMTCVKTNDYLLPKQIAIVLKIKIRK